MQTKEEKFDPRAAAEALRHYAVSDAPRLFAENQRMRELLRAVPSYLNSLGMRIDHPCPLRDGVYKLRDDIEALLGDK